MSFTVYRSSAGSGKTFSLVREYLKMVLRHPVEFRHILAITFTHKAANEMKERVMATLRDLATKAPDSLTGSSREMLKSLILETELPADELSRRAGEVLSHILHRYSEFSIGTIDSFFHRIIRAFAYDFGLPVSFNVELESEELLTQAVDLMLEKAGSDKELTQLLVSFLESLMEEDKGWNIDHLLVDFAGVLLDEEGETEVKKLASVTIVDFQSIGKLLVARIRSIEEQYKELGLKALDLIAGAAVPETSFYHGRTGIPGYFSYLAQGRMNKLNPNSYVRTTLDKYLWVSQKATPEEIHAINMIKGELEQLCRQAVSLNATQKESYSLAKLLRKTIYPLAVLNEITRVLDDVKKQHNLVHISEFNRRIARIVLHEPVPFIYERLGERFHHVLIDEFQDTSRLQWLNFVPLMENALASGYFNLVVGDGKQAIYRWRNGEVTQFTSLPALPGSEENSLIRQRQTLFVGYFNELFLDFNFRSLPGIVDFNNRFFRWLAQHLDPSLQNVYDNLEQHPASGRMGGYIRLDIIAKDKKEPLYTEQTIIRIREIISRLLKEGYALADIAILCRKNKQAGRIARELILSGINVISAESLLLSYSPEVRMIITLIRSLFDPENTILQASVLNCLHQSGRLKEEMDDPHPLFLAIGESELPEDRFFEILKRNGLTVDKEELLGLPLYDLCETLIRLFGFQTVADPYIQFFLDAVSRFLEKESQSAADFPDWWEQHQGELSIVVPEGVDAVRVMTIHKAKGLEFKVVILPYADESLNRTSKNYLWIELPPGEKIPLKTAFLPFEKALDETIFREEYRVEKAKSLLDIVNALYVAMTRPEEQLYILTVPPPAKSDELNSLPAFFEGYLRSAGIWEDGRDSYEFGEVLSKLDPAAQEKLDIRMLTSLPSINWRDIIKIRHRAPAFFEVEDPAGKVDFGSRIHAILAEIRTEADIDSAVTKAFLAGNLSPEEESALRHMLYAITAHPLLSGCFDPTVTVRNEPEIIEPAGDAYRPDRVVQDGEKVTVIDYKTGRKSPSHHQQIRRYGRLLEEMGHSNVKKLLVYLGNTMEVEEVSD